MSHNSRTMWFKSNYTPKNVYDVIMLMWCAQFNIVAVLNSICGMFYHFRLCLGIFYPSITEQSAVMMILFNERMYYPWISSYCSLWFTIIVICNKNYVTDRMIDLHLLANEENKSNAKNVLMQYMCRKMFNFRRW